MTVKVFIPDIPEFMPLVSAAQKVEECKVLGPLRGYWIVTAEQQLRFNRRALSLGPAIWNSALSGGFIGKLVEYGRDDMVIQSET